MKAIFASYVASIVHAHLEQITADQINSKDDSSCHEDDASTVKISNQTPSEEIEAAEDKLLVVLRAYPDSPDYLKDLLCCLSPYACGEIRRPFATQLLACFAKEHELSSFNISDMLDATDTLVGVGETRRVDKWKSFYRKQATFLGLKHLPMALADLFEESSSAENSSLTQNSSRTIWSKMTTCLSSLNCSLLFPWIGGGGHCGPGASSGNTTYSVQGNKFTCVELNVGERTTGHVETGIDPTSMAETPLLNTTTGYGTIA